MAQSERQIDGRIDRLNASGRDIAPARGNAPVAVAAAAVSALAAGLKALNAGLKEIVALAGIGKGMLKRLIGSLRAYHDPAPSRPQPPRVLNLEPPERRRAAAAHAIAADRSIGPDHRNGDDHGNADRHGIVVEGRASELTRSQLEHQRQSAFLRAVLDSMGDGLVAVDAKGKLLLFNPRAEQILGISDLRGEIAGYFDRKKSGREMGADLGVDVDVDAGGAPAGARDNPILAAIRGEERDNVELCLQPRGRAPLWLEVGARPLRDEQGMVLGGIVVFRDIGARKRGEQQQAHLAAIVNASHDAIISATPAGIIQSWNSGAERLFGYTAAEVAGKSCALLEPPEGLGQASLVFDKLALELATQQYETRQMKRDGTLLYVSTVLSPILDAAGGLAAASMVVRDITEHTRVVRELENRTRELQSSNEELEQFAHSASHDLQEPLRMVTSYVQLLGERYSGRLDADADEFIGFAVDGAARMKQLLGGLLAYSRVGRGRDFTAVAATEALQWALKNLALALAESGATVTCDVLPQVLADRAQLGELFQNLLGNAIKFRGQRRPEIRIGAERRGKEWVFAVADNGIGLDPRHAESIFVMFRRLHRSSEYPGTGIGLAICRKIVERHGGRIWVDAEPGNGAVFRFTLPAVTTVAVEAVTVAAENDRHADV